MYVINKTGECVDRRRISFSFFLAFTRPVSHLLVVPTKNVKAICQAANETLYCARYDTLHLSFLRKKKLAEHIIVKYVVCF